MNRSNRLVVLKPSMIGNLIKFDTLLRINFQELLDQVFRDWTESAGPLDLVIEDVFE